MPKQSSNEDLEKLKKKHAEQKTMKAKFKNEAKQKLINAKSKCELLLKEIDQIIENDSENTETAFSLSADCHSQVNAAWCYSERGKKTILIVKEEAEEKARKHINTAAANVEKLLEHIKSTQQKTGLEFLLEAYGATLPNILGWISSNISRAYDESSKYLIDHMDEVDEFYHKKSNAN